MSIINELRLKIDKRIDRITNKTPENNEEMTEDEIISRFIPFSQIELDSFANPTYLGLLTEEERQKEQRKIKKIILDNYLTQEGIIPKSKYNPKKSYNSFSDIPFEDFLTFTERDLSSLLSKNKSIREEIDQMDLKYTKLHLGFMTMTEGKAYPEMIEAVYGSQEHAQEYLETSEKRKSRIEKIKATIAKFYFRNTCTPEEFKSLNNKGRSSLIIKTKHFTWENLERLVDAKSIWG